MAETSDEAFWNRIARKYARDKISDMAGYQRSLSRTRDLLAADRTVLELGCGTGTTALALAPSAGGYLATDISSQMIAIAQEKLRETPIARLSFRQATAQTLSQDGRTFDVVLGFNYLHLVRDLPETLAAIARLTKPGGLFVSKTACIAEMNPLIRLAIPLMQLVGKAPFVGVFSANPLVRAIEAAGFEVLACERHASKGRDARPFVLARRR